jgi:hypothetical protein
VEVSTAGGVPVTLELRTPQSNPPPDGSQRDGLYKIQVVDHTVYRIRSAPSLVGPVDVDTPQDNIIRLNDDPSVPAKARPVFAVGSAGVLFMPSQVYSLPYPAFDADLACTSQGCSAP